MTQEERDLLLRDLCARLPYGVRCSFGVNDAIYEVCGVNQTCCGASEIQATHIKSGINGNFLLSSCKPYLFPLTSMMEEQHKEWFRTLSSDYQITYDSVNWLLKNHFDYHSLIEKGLAIDCSNLKIY